MATRPVQSAMAQASESISRALQYGDVPSVFEPLGVGTKPRGARRGGQSRFVANNRTTRQLSRRERR